MSIKKELEKLRKKQEKLEKEIEQDNDKKQSEMKSLQQTEQSLIQFKDKKSEVAKKIYEELYQKSKESKDNIKRIEENIDKCKNECISIKSRINELCDDTSSYIKEQVNYLISKFTSYVVKNEIMLGKNIRTEFIIGPCKYSVGRVPYNYMLPDGRFEIEKKTEECYLRVAVTKEYYFDNKIIVGYTDWKCILSDWYQEYENNFIKSFFEKLKNDFYSENFKVVDIDDMLGKFTIELI